MRLLTPTSQDPRASSSRKRVLIASARGLDAELGRTLLWRADIERVFARAADAALEIARSAAPSLTIVDASDRESALDLIRRLRQDAATHSTAIVALIPPGGGDDEEVFRGAGANLVLAGPVSPVLWDARLSELLSVPRRRELRVPVLLELWSVLGPDQEPLAGLGLNISVHGMLIETDRPLEVGCKLDLAFGLPGRPEDLRVVGQVVRDAGYADGRWRGGVRFLVLRGDARERIERFVDSVRWPGFMRAASVRGVDLPERREWEAELRASDARHAGILQSVFDGVVTLDSQERIVEFNPAAERAFGYRRAEVLGRRATDLLVPVIAREEHRQALALCLTSAGGPWHRETTLRRADGSEFPADISFTAVQADGRRFVTACVRDVTQRRRAEDAHRASARQFRALFEGALDPMLVADDEGRCVEANAAAAGLFGLERARLLGRWLGDLAEAGFDFAASWAALRQVGTAQGELPVARADGTSRDVEMLTTVDFLPGSHLVVLRDMTERRLLEAQFRQAQKMEAVGRLAGGVAHDFNNLLGVIIGYSDMLARQLPDSSPAARKASEIRKAADRAAGLTRQLLAFSRKQVLQPKLIDLNVVISDATRMLRRLIGEDVELDLRLAPGLGAVKADPGQMEQVLMNLLVNARDAMPDGGRISVSTENVDLDEPYLLRHAGARPGPHVRLRVSDTGIGMDAETQRHIFEPFFTTRETGKGTGLGLAMVYGIVKQSDGYIWVDSAPGQGASFDVFLPHVGRPAAAVPLAPARSAAERGVETVLLVEDEESLRDMASELLESSGYGVLAAASGEQALRLSRDHTGSIDLLLTDVVMPGMTGPALAEALQAERPDMRVLFVSGYADPASTPRRLPSGKAFLQKPFSASALETKVREVLSGRAPSRG